MLQKRVTDIPRRIIKGPILRRAKHSRRKTGQVYKAR
jgi:hypothetical protein